MSVDVQCVCVCVCVCVSVCVYKHVCVRFLCDGLTLAVVSPKCKAVAPSCGQAFFLEFYSGTSPCPSLHALLCTLSETVCVWIPPLILLTVSPNLPVTETLMTQLKGRTLFM